MSAITKEQMLKFAAAWQAVILIIPWYMNEFGVDETNRLIGWLALLVVFVVVFLNKDNTAKVVTAVATLDDFLSRQSPEGFALTDVEREAIIWSREVKAEDV